MRLSRALPMVAIVCLMGCNSAVTNPTEVAGLGDAPTVAEAEQTITRAVSELLPLVDPDSAQIRNIGIDGPRKWTMPRGSGIGWQVHFWLNAKNQMGGYAGPRKYLCLICPDGRYGIKEATAWD